MRNQRVRVDVQRSFCMISHCNIIHHSERDKQHGFRFRFSKIVLKFFIEWFVRDSFLEKPLILF